MRSIRTETTVSTYGSVEIARLRKEYDQLAVLTNSSWFFCDVASDFDGLGGYRTLEYEGQVPTKPYNCCFS